MPLPNIQARPLQPGRSKSNAFLSDEKLDTMCVLVGIIYLIDQIQKINCSPCLVKVDRSHYSQRTLRGSRPHNSWGDRVYYAVAYNSGSCVRVLGAKDAFPVRAELLKPPGMITVSIKASFQVENPHQYLLIIGRWGYMSATGIFRALVLSGRLLQNGCLFSCLLCVRAPRGELKMALILIIHHCPCLLGP